MLERFKRRLTLAELEIPTDEGLLEEMLDSARALFLRLRYPVSSYPVDDAGVPIIETRWEDWILRAAVEMHARIGAESQMSHSENGISRTWDAGTISIDLQREVTPIVRVAR